MVFQILHEALHVCTVVGRYQSTCNGNVCNRVTGDQYDAMSKMDFIDRQSARERCKSLSAKLLTIELSDFMF